MGRPPKREVFGFYREGSGGLGRGGGCARALQAIRDSFNDSGELGLFSLPTLPPPHSPHPQAAQSDATLSSASIYSSQHSHQLCHQSITINAALGQHWKVLATAHQLIMIQHSKFIQ